MGDLYPCCLRARRLTVSLSRYWPTRDEINRCIKTEAESASDAVLLAVHQSMPLVRRDEGSQVESQVSEHDLLEAFVSDDLPQGTLLMPITGASGSGKSHMIRWLAAQLGRDPRSSHMHVIRIPKSASLRHVVELVLEPLASDSRFSEVRESLDKAIAQVTPFEAAVRFSGALEIALNDLKDSLLSKLHSNTPSSSSREMKKRAYHASKLPGFLNDAALREHMTSQVLSPIIQRAVSGRAEPALEEEELMPQFRASDLQIPDELHGALGQAATPVRTYYQTGLSRTDGAGRTEAASVLNEVVDGAIQKVFQIDQATGSVTLESIILQVRELLLEQGRELVLLIEDFAALSGIQQVLLSVCIQEAERDGRQVRSRMRTALALTDGYLVGRDTIATRARQVWCIQESTGNMDVISRSVELIGGYLNAARWGESALIEKYEQSSILEETDLTTWVDAFKFDDLTPDVSTQLHAFGASGSGVPLFPYNRLAIAELAKRRLGTAGTMHFNPRRIINFILREILLFGRDVFEKGEFPPAGFEDAKASASLANWLAGEPLSMEERQRIEALMVYWGGNPSDPEQAATIPSEVFRSFNIEYPDGLSSWTETGGGTAPKLSPSPADPTPPALPIDALEIDGWRQRLDDWASGTELGQRDSQKLRNVLLRYLEKAIPWNGLRLGKRNLSLLLKIPNARGNAAAAAIRIAIAEDHNDPNGQLRNALLGAIRLDKSNGRMNYSEAAEDSARVASLVERILENLIPHLKRQRDQDVRILSWILRRQAQILGLVPRARMSLFESKVQAVRNPSDKASQDLGRRLEDKSRWQQLRCETMQMRPELQQALWDRIGCFQGDGKKDYAIDPTLIEDDANIEQFEVSLLSGSQREHLAKLKPTRLKPAVRPLVDQLKALSKRLNDLLGSKQDKQGLVSALNCLLVALEPAGVWPDGFTRPEVDGLIETFRNEDLKRQLDEASPLLAENAELDLTADSTLERLGRIDFAVIERSEAFLKRMESFVDAVKSDLSVKERELIGIDPKADATTLVHTLDQIDRDLCIIGADSSP